MRRTTDTYIQCPYFESEYRLTISCEGLIADTCVTNRFPSTADKRTHFIRHCFKVNGGGCPIALELYRKYGADPG